MVPNPWIERDVSQRRFAAQRNGITSFRAPRPALIFAALLSLTLSACNRDLILDLGEGDSIRLVGHADNFDCDDPAYAKVDKVQTFTIQYADGTTQRLCSPKGSKPNNK